MKTPVLIASLLLLSAACLAQVHLGPGQAYPNIQAAVSAGAVQPGDTVFLHAGSYQGYQGISALKGTNANRIVITRYQNDPIDISGGWQFISCEYIKFLNLNFKGNALYPGRLLSIDNNGSCATQSRYIVVDSCSFVNTTDAAAITAFKFGGVDDFEVTNCIFRDIPVCEAMDYNVCHNGLIRGNLFENCLSGGHIKGGASNITMERNIFINASKNGWVAFELGGDTGAQFYCPGDDFEVKNLNFYSNIIIGGYRGLALSSAIDCKVVNNTFYNCGQATMRFLTTSVLYPALTGNKVENNLFAFGTSAYFNGGIQPPGAATFSNNIYYSIINTTFNGPYWDTPDLNAIKDPNPLNYGSGTPMFVNGSGYDFNLVAGSPAIGNGKAETEPATDFYGKPFSAVARSIGAIEAVPTTGIDEKTEADTPDHVIIYPNPAGEYMEVRTEKYCGLVEIFSPLGFKLFESESGERILTGHLPSGVYSLKAGNKICTFIKM